MDIVSTSRRGGGSGGGRPPGGGGSGSGRPPGGFPGGTGGGGRGTSGGGRVPGSTGSRPIRSNININGNGTSSNTNRSTTTTSPSLSHDDVLKDMRLQLQQLLLSTDFVLQPNNSNNRRVIGTASDDYLEQLAPIIREAISKDNTSDLIETLDGLQRLKDREINQICSGDHNEYMSSVQQLDQVVQEASSIKSTIAKASQNITKSGTKLAKAKNNYLKAQLSHSNINSTIEAVEACLQVLELTNNVHQLLREKRKFAALKSLDDLRNVHLKEVSDFGFAQLIEKSLPALNKMVRTSTLSDMDNWLTELSQRNSIIGKDIFDRVEKQKAVWKNHIQENPRYRRCKFNSPVELSYRESKPNYLTSDAVELDLSILYECVLVHSSLGLSTQFKHHFENDRKIQRDYLVPNSLSDNDQQQPLLDEVATIFHRVVGFCVIDRIISRRLPNLRPAREVDDIWESISQKIDHILSSQVMTKIHDPDILIGLKKQLGTLLHAMQNFGFDTSGIEQIILKLFQWYSKILSKSFESMFIQNLQRDDYMPMAIQTPDMYNEICKVAWYHPDPNSNEFKRPFPKVLPFSEIYIVCCKEVRSFVIHHQSFLEELQHDPCQIEDILQSALDNLLLNIVCKTLEDRLRSTTREQIVQILINLEYFENASHELENLLSNERISDRRGKIVLEATSGFAKARKKAEERIFELLNSVVDNFLDLADYDWGTTVISDKPSSYLVDMAKFLKTMVNSALVNLPQAIKSFVYFDAFDHLSASLLKFLLDSGDNITLESVVNFDVDVKYLEEFVNELGSDANDMSLTTTVTELRQSVDLLMSDNINDYNNPLIRMKKYDRVKPENAQTLFGKISYALQQLRLQQQQESETGDASSISSGGNNGGSLRNSYSSTATRSPKGSTLSSSSAKLKKMYQKVGEKINEKVN